ncbi:hypothetical protein N7499_012509 [Penicillium canescens]|nr:hypothetical protein N7499_012509 [Penicillium canescens]KAJ6154677.1 hypothetical protein N7485_013046 [Penicillium canescens]
MDGLEVVPGSEMASVKSYSGPQVVPETEKEVKPTRGGLHYVEPNYIPQVKPDYVPPLEKNNKVGPPQGRDHKRICGVRSTIFWLLLVIAILVVIIAGVGGGIGGYFLNKNSRNSDSSTPASTNSILSPKTTASSVSTTSSIPDPTTTSTVSETSSGPVTSGTSGIASNPCPGQNLTTITGSNGAIFTLLCAVDWPSGDGAANGKGKVGDLDWSTEYTLPSCISQCVDWNADSSKAGTCKGVVYSANLTAAYDGGQEGNCFLKDRVGKYFPNADTSMAAGLLG